MFNHKISIYLFSFYFISLCASSIVASELEEEKLDVPQSKDIIACFGASITQQAHGNGYVDGLVELLPTFEVKRFGYGGRAIFPGGVIHLDEVLTCRPKILLLDWSINNFVRGFQEIKDVDDLSVELAIKTIIKKAQARNVQPFFVHMPRLDGYCNNVVTAIIDNLANELNYSILDLRNFFKAGELSECLRDVMHTNPRGARLYANAIKDFLEGAFLKTPYAIEFTSPYENISYLPFNADIKRKLCFRFKGQFLNLAYIIGPHSNVLKTSCDGKFLCKTNTWDLSAYYERSMERLLEFQALESEKITIEILNEVIERTSSREQKPQTFWDSFEPCLKLRGFYYIGQLTDIEIFNDEDVTDLS